MAYRIRELREKKKLTQEQLAQMSGVSRTTIVLLENNDDHYAEIRHASGPGFAGDLRGHDGHRTVRERGLYSRLLCRLLQCLL